MVLSELQVNFFTSHLVVFLRLLGDFSSYHLSHITYHLIIFTCHTMRKKQQFSNEK